MYTGGAEIMKRIPFSWVECLMPSVIMHRLSVEHRAFAVETFFKNNGSAKLGQNQLDNLNLAPCRHLCRWCSETHIAG
jgi:hypothetical protein